MSWAAGRRFIILCVLGAIIVAFLAIVGIATFYKAPSCSDGVKNQEETGVDCGGPCAYLCIDQQRPPTVLYTQAIQNGEGRVDVIAKVENKNAASAARNVPYAISLYGSDQTLVQKVTGFLDLPPGVSVPIFVPGTESGKRVVTNAFLDIEPSSPKWFFMQSDMRIIPKVSNIKQGGTTSAPRIEAVFFNSSTVSLSNIRAVVIVHNDKGAVIAASSTIVPTIPPQDQATATFTWNSAFTDAPASVEVIPVVPLPDRQSDLP
jgi:hypothetical protein